MFLEVSKSICYTIQSSMNDCIGHHDVICMTCPISLHRVSRIVGKLSYPDHNRRSYLKNVSDAIPQKIS